MFSVLSSSFVLLSTLLYILLRVISIRTVFHGRKYPISVHRRFIYRKKKTMRFEIYRDLVWTGPIFFLRLINQRLNSSTRFFYVLYEQGMMVPNCSNHNRYTQENVRDITALVTCSSNYSLTYLPKAEGQLMPY